MSKMRLDKYLAFLGYGSRKDVKTLIRKSDVYVNHVKVNKEDYSLDPNVDKVVLNGEELVYEEFVYLLLNKPQGYLSATEDYKAHTVLDLVPEYAYRHLFPVGRLDKDTTGCLILTDDGDLCHTLTSPKYHVDKVYDAVVDKAITDFNVMEKGFREGIILDGEKTLPATIKQVSDHEVLITLHEGRFHQVKNMCSYFGYNVVSLDRIQFSTLNHDDLALGEYRKLSAEEVKALKK